MNFLATYIMRNRTSAVMVAIATAVISLLLPPLSYLSGAVVGMVTLRHGGREGLTVLGIAGLLIAIPALLSGSSGLVMIFSAFVWLPVWLLAMVLRQTVSLSYAIVGAALLGFVCVVIVHAAVAEPSLWWRDKLELLQPILAEAGWKPADITASLDTLANAMTAMLASVVMITPLVSLFIARWWQASLYNPGGWRKEFYQLRLPAKLVWVAIAIVMAAWLASGSVQAFAADLLLVVLLLYLLQGLSVIHNLVNQRGFHVAWLAGIYGLLLIVPQAVMLVSGLGFVDTWADFRSRIKADIS